MQALDIQQQAQRSKRLSRQDRRDQLLKIANEIMETDGADALTLAVLAERAGVSKPVAYDHFETRAGLLQAMLENLGRYYENDARVQIEAAPKTLAATTRIMSEAYVACTLEAGPSVSILLAAVEANADAQEAGRIFRAHHAKQLQEAIAPFVSGDNARIFLLCTALIAAADAICAEMTNGRITAEFAVDTLTQLLTASLSPFALISSKKDKQ